MRGIVADAPEGQAYLADLAWARAYADANRRAIIAATGEVLRRRAGVTVELASWIGSDHNHVRREEHGEGPVWVHRKGAISAATAEPGLVPGSMGTASFHVRGRGVAAALASSAHGAGRALSRGVARRRISVGAVRAQLEGVWFDHRLAHALRDEAPAAYKDVDRVLHAQRALVTIVRRVRPRLVYKGGG